MSSTENTQIRPAERWAPWHKRKRAVGGGSVGFSCDHGVYHWFADCECGAIFRGKTKEGRDRFRAAHAAHEPGECECCGRSLDY